MYYVRFGISKIVYVHENRGSFPIKNMFFVSYAFLLSVFITFGYQNARRKTYNEYMTEGNSDLSIVTSKSLSEKIAC